MPHFQTFHAFLTMGGYAASVWPAFGLTVAVLAWNVFYPWMQYRRLLRSLRDTSHASTS